MRKRKRNSFFFLQNKDFVYRGSEWEKISTFTQRLASEFPHAQLLTSNSREPDNTLKCEDGQFVQICCVKPVQQSQLSGTISHPMEGYDMPDKIRKFHQVNNISNFQYDRPYHKGSKDRDNEFKVSSNKLSKKSGKLKGDLHCYVNKLSRIFKVIEIR